MLVIEMVEKIGEYSNTDLELSTISNDKDSIKAKVNAKGSWAGVMKALILLENLQVSSSISNISLNTSLGLDGGVLKSGEKKSTNQNIWNLSLDIQALTSK